MSAKENKGLTVARNVASFVGAWAIVGWQMWRTQYGEEPNWMLMGLAAGILVPSLVPYMTGGRWPIAPSPPPESSPSPSSSPSESGG